MANKRLKRLQRLKRLKRLQRLQRLQRLKVLGLRAGAGGVGAHRDRAGTRARTPRWRHRSAPPLRRSAARGRRGGTSAAPHPGAPPSPAQVPPH
eukprot:1187684-Prorocentrum_minimum.AAC.2